MSEAGLTETERALLAYFRASGPATAADALRAVEGAKRRHVDKLHRRGILVSAPSPGRGNVLRAA